MAVYASRTELDKTTLSAILVIDIVYTVKKTIASKCYKLIVTYYHNDASLTHGFITVVAILIAKPTVNIYMYLYTSKCKIYYYS